MIRLKKYRKEKKDRRVLGSSLKRTPIALRSKIVRQRLKNLKSNLAEYRMLPRQALVEHVKMLMTSLQEITNRSHVLNNTEKYIALYKTLPPSLQENLKNFYLK